MSSGPTCRRSAAAARFEAVDEGEVVDHRRDRPEVISTSRPAVAEHEGYPVSLFGHPQRCLVDIDHPLTHVQVPSNLAVMGDIESIAGYVPASL